MKFLQLVFRNLLRNRRRTILTALSIAVSVFVFSALIALPAVVDQITAARASSLRLVCHSKAGLAYSLPAAYLPRIAASPHVVAASGWMFFGGIYHDIHDQFPNFAVDHEHVELIWPDWGISPAAVAEFKRIRTACLVGPETMRRFKWHVGQQIMLRGTVYPVNLTLQIVGEIKVPGDGLLFRRDYMEEAIGRKGVISMYMLTVDQAESIPTVIAELDESFANSGAETQTESEASFIGGFLAALRPLMTMAKVLALIVIITIGLVAANTAAMSIRERRTEVAVLRSLGFSASLVMNCLLAESTIIGLVGGIAGSAGAYLVLKAVGFGLLGPFHTAGVPPAVLFESMAVAALIGLMSAFVPARAAVRRSIVDTLRAVA